MNVSTLGNNHQHSITECDAQNGHGLEFDVAYSNAGGGTGTQSLLVDNQTQGTTQASQLGGDFVGGIQTANAPHDHNTSDSLGTDHSHTLAPMSHNRVAVMETSTDTSHTHTTQVSDGGEPHFHTFTTLDSSIMHKHVVLPTLQANIDHNHAIQTNQTSIDHNHIIQTTPTSIDHNHIIQTTPTSINHNHIIQTTPTSINHNHIIQTTPTSIDYAHVIETAQSSINHNHVIGTTYTGSGSNVDNRPKWVGLWYIMKL
jgi:hypothetical protein